MIPIFDTYISANAKNNVLDCLQSGWISSQGKYVLEFEKNLSKYFKMKYCLATSNCTTALHLSILSLDLKKKDEIICPALSFIAPANMILLSGARLVLVDIDPETLTIDPKKLEKAITKKTKAILIVHQFGHAAHMDEIIKLSKKYKLKIIEDNAESIGGKYKNKLLGTLGDVSTLSFFANKIITTGEGGAILTNSKKKYLMMKEMRDHGMKYNEKYNHVRMGFNYRMTNMQAAIGCDQINNLNKILKKRKIIEKIYYENLKDLKHVELRQFKKWCSPVNWLITIKLKKEGLRNKFIKYLKDFKIDSRQMINPINEAYHIKDLINKKFQVSKKISINSVHLPSGLNLSKNQINKICKRVKLFFKEY